MNLDDHFEVAQFSIERLDEINDRLKEISLELKAYQPPISGRLTLELSKCSEKGCIACPHPRWMAWKTIKNKFGSDSYASKDVNDPWRRIKASGEFKENYEYIKLLVIEARDLIKEKEMYVKGFQKLRVACRSSNKKTDS